MSDEFTKAVVAWEGKLNNFFLKAMDVSRHSGPKYSLELSAADEDLPGALDKAKIDVDAALCDSFDTPAVMRILSGIVTEFTRQRLSRTRRC